MGCGCGRTAQSFQVKMPNGEIKVYSSIIAARAKLKGTPGATPVNFEATPV